MEMHIRYFAGVIALTGAALFASGVNADDRKKGSELDTIRVEEPRARMESEKLGDSNVLNDIRATFRSIVNTAVDEGNFADVVEYLAKADRDRVEAVAKESTPALDGQIKAFKENWRSKYNHGFDIDSNTVGAAFDYKMSHDSDKKTANVKLPAVHELSESTLKLVNEGTITNAWRLDIADTTTGVQLRQALEKEFTRLNDQKSTLPANEEEAKKLVAHRLLAAIAGSSPL